MASARIEKNEFKTYKLMALNAAMELGYSVLTVEKIKAATTTNMVENIMRTARKNNEICSHYWGAYEC